MPIIRCFLLEPHVRNVSHTSANFIGRHIALRRIIKSATRPAILRLCRSARFHRLSTSFEYRNSDLTKSFPLRHRIIISIKYPLVTLAIDYTLALRPCASNNLSLLSDDSNASGNDGVIWMMAARPCIHYTELIIKLRHKININPSFLTSSFTC